MPPPDSLPGAPLAALEASVLALGPDDLTAFRAWFFYHCITQTGQRTFGDVARPAAFYERFDPDAYDDESEALEDWSHGRWVDDLRSLRTEAQVLAAEAQTAREPPSDFSIFREMYLAEHPEPRHTATPEVRAEWQWAFYDAYYERMERLGQLAQHRNEKGTYVARWTEVYRGAQKDTDALLGPLKNRRPRTPEEDEAEREPWPPVDPDADLRRLRDVTDADDLAHNLRMRETNAAYARADDLYAGTFGWMKSLPMPRPEGWMVPYQSVHDGAMALKRAAEADFRPGHIGDTLLRLKRTLALADDVLAHLDEAAREPWVTPAAHRRLTVMTVAARDALLDRYVEARAAYTALREVSDRVLGSAPA